jgi:hypothetical protein
MPRLLFQELERIQPEHLAATVTRVWLVSMCRTIDPSRLLLISVAGWLGQQAPEPRPEN